MRFVKTGAATGSRFFVDRIPASWDDGPPMFPGTVLSIPWMFYAYHCSRSSSEQKAGPIAPIML